MNITLTTWLTPVTAAPIALHACHCEQHADEMANFRLQLRRSRPIRDTMDSTQKTRLTSGYNCADRAPYVPLWTAH